MLCYLSSEIANKKLRLLDSLDPHKILLHFRSRDNLSKKND